MTTVGVCIEDDRTVITTMAATEAVNEWVVPCGMASLSRRHFTCDPPLPEDLTNAIGEMIDHLDDAVRELPWLAAATTIVVSGPCARAIAAVEHGAVVRDVTFALTRDAAEDVFRTLATEPTRDRRHNPGLPAALADTIVGGCCAMVALIRCLHLDTITIDTGTIDTGTIDTGTIDTGTIDTGTGTIDTGTGTIDTIDTISEAGP